MPAHQGTWRFKATALVLATSAALTYLSLAVPGQVVALCSNVEKSVYCPVLAYGFPLPFLADSQAVSPVGSVARDPLSLLIGLDDVLWLQAGLSGVFWIVTVMAGRALWLRLTDGKKS
jgi:hypothetical protein